MIGKAEVMRAGDNPRFVVTSLPAEGFADDAEPTRFTPARLYEECYCARGDMENQLKQQVLDVQADRLSTHHLGSNQLRLWWSTLAYLLLERMRAVGLAGTELAHATAGSLRLKLLKVAAQVRQCPPGVCAVEQRLALAQHPLRSAPQAAARAGLVVQVAPPTPTGSRPPDRKLRPRERTAPKPRNPSLRPELRQTALWWVYHKATRRFGAPISLRHYASRPLCCRPMNYPG